MGTPAYFLYPPILPCTFHSPNLFPSKANPRIPRGPFELSVLAKEIDEWIIVRFSFLFLNGLHPEVSFKPILSWSYHGSKNERYKLEQTVYLNNCYDIVFARHQCTCWEGKFVVGFFKNPAIVGRA